MKGLTLEQMQFLVGKGCTAEEMLAFAQMAGGRSKAAERTARWRSKKAGNVTESVTSDVTSDASPPPNEYISNPPVSSDDETTPRRKKSVQGSPAKPDDVSEPVWIAFRKLRAKKGGLSDIALAGIRREAVKAGWSMEAALTRCVEKNWQGFEAEWVESRPGKPGTTGPPSMLAHLTQKHRHHQESTA